MAAPSAHEDVHVLGQTASTENGAASQPTGNELFEQLPCSVLTAILRAVIAYSSPASVMATAVTCKALYAACSQADDLWQPQCTSLGWRDGSRCSPAFRVYSSRMTTRKMVRQHVLRLMPYLPLQAQLTFNRGASVKQLAAAEERLGLALPWQLWELLRYKNGQTPGPWGWIIDHTRLLDTEELFVETRDLPSISLAPQRRHSQPVPGFGNREPSPPSRQDTSSASIGHDTAHASTATESHTHAPVDGGDGATPGGVANRVGDEAPASVEAAADMQAVQLVVFASNPGGSKAYAVTAGGEVYVLRGILTTRKIADGIVAFLQHILA